MVTKTVKFDDRQQLSGLCASMHLAPSSSALGWPRVQRALRACNQKRVAVIGAGCALSCMAVLPGSAAASAGDAAWDTLPPRVCAVLDHLVANPMSVTSTAMQYDADPTVPLPDAVRGLNPEDCMLTVSGRGRPAAAAAAARPPDAATAHEHTARIVAAALYAACGGLDAAHNLVTPLCWGSWTPYAGEAAAGAHEQIITVATAAAPSAASGGKYKFPSFSLSVFSLYFVCVCVFVSKPPRIVRSATCHTTASAPAFTLLSVLCSALQVSRYLAARLLLMPR